MLLRSLGAASSVLWLAAASLGAQPAGLPGSVTVSVPTVGDVVLPWSDAHGEYFATGLSGPVNSLRLQANVEEGFGGTDILAVGIAQNLDEAWVSLSGPFGAWESFVDGNGDEPLSSVPAGDWTLTSGGISLTGDFAQGSGSFRQGGAVPEPATLGLLSLPLLILLRRSRRTSTHM
jgi:hypothetical protein